MKKLSPYKLIIDHKKNNRIKSYDEDERKKR